MLHMRCLATSWKCTVLQVFDIATLDPLVVKEAIAKGAKFLFASTRRHYAADEIWPRISESHRRVEIANRNEDAHRYVYVDNRGSDICRIVGLPT